MRSTVFKSAVFHKLAECFAGKSCVGASLADGLIGVAWSLGEGHDAVPVGRSGDAVHAGAVEFLIWPEGVAYVVVFKHVAEGGLSLVGVVSDFAHVHRQPG